jgi:hypothetical protein
MQEIGESENKGISSQTSFKYILPYIEKDFSHFYEFGHS